MSNPQHGNREEPDEDASYRSIDYSAPAEPHAAHLGHHGRGYEGQQEGYGEQYGAYGEQREGYGGWQGYGEEHFNGQHGAYPEHHGMYQEQHGDYGQHHGEAPVTGNHGYHEYDYDYGVTDAYGRETSYNESDPRYAEMSPKFRSDDKGDGSGFLAAEERGVGDAELQSRNPLFRGLRRLFRSGVEARGIERVPEDERDGKHTIGLLLLWWSVNCVVSTFPIGLLAQAYFTLDFKSTVAAIVAFTAIGAACCGFIATLGPQTGLRTIVISRYSVGFVGGTIFAVLNILTQLGFSCTAVILGGQTLTNVSEGKLPLEASIVIVGFMGLVLCFVGYEAVHHWERYAWIVQCVFYCCILGLAAHKGFNIKTQEAKQSKGKEFAGGFLSFGGIVFSSAAGWAPIAADFNCRLPSTISPWKVFFLTWFGLMVPLLFIEMVSAAVMSVPDYAAAFETGDAGGVLFEIFRPWKAGGKFILTVMSLSIISNIAPNTYSASLSAQTLLPLFQKIPRALWCVFMFCVYTAAAIGGREHFSVVLSNFLSILGYWIAFFIIVVLEEHFIFRRHIGYDLTVYNSISRLPIGAAGIIACCAGAGAAVVGMAQVWFVGPLARVFGEEGGDLGFEMSAVATAVFYPPLRWIEYRIFGR